MFKIGTSNFLRTYAPDFCWCSAHDLFIMMEQIPELEDVTEDTFKVTLSRLKIQGVFITKPNYYRPEYNSRSRIGDLYLRVK